MPASQRAQGFLDRFGHRLFGALAFVLCVALALSVPMSSSGVAAAEDRAQALAEQLAAEVVEPELTLDLLSRDITGTAYRDLTVAVQGQILTDDRIALVRIWRLDGALIYSSAQRDDVARTAARGDAAIERAFLGQTTSVLSGDAVYHVGLKRPTEELFQTFVPIRLGDPERVDGIVEIDQRYAAIRGAALGTWRPVQAALAVLFVAAVAMAVRAAHRAPPRPKRWERHDEDEYEDDRRRWSPDRWRRGRTEPNATAEPPPAVPSVEIEELELKLRASEAEREQHAGEVQRLRSALADREAELQRALSGASDTRTESKRAKRLVAEADRRAAESQRRAADLERKLDEATKRATAAADRALEVEARLGALERDHAESERAKPKEPSDRKLAVELKRAQGQGERLARTLAEREEELERLRAEIDAAREEQTAGAGAAERAAELERANAELEDRLRALGARVEELAGTNEDLARRNEELEQRHAELERGYAELAAGGGSGETEAKLAEALAKLDELERARRTGPEAGEDVVTLRERVAELERARRDDVAELQRAQESFANAQVELVNTTRKLKEAEALIRELEDAHGALPAIDHLSTEAGGAGVEAARDRANGEAAPELKPALAALEPEFASSGDLGPIPSWFSPATPPEPEHDESPAEGLSLRERLARAAAARRRGPLS